MKVGIYMDHIKVKKDPLVVLHDKSDLRTDLYKLNYKAQVVQTQGIDSKLPLC